MLHHQGGVIFGRVLLACAILWVFDTNAGAAVATEESANLESYLFSQTELHTEEFLVNVHGTPFLERYAAGYSERTPHLAWSVSKTVLAALVGIAVQDGKLELKDSICRFLPAAKSRPASHGRSYCSIRVMDLLGWESGLDWREDYEGGDITRSSVIQMLYGKGRLDMASYVLDHSIKADPGKVWNYSSGDSVLLAAILQAAFADDPRFAWTKLFDPLGMRGVTWETDGAGVLVGSSYLYATARDLARFGELLARNGALDGRRYLPTSWIDASSRFPTAFSADEKWIATEDRPGFHLWINRPHPLDPAHRKLIAGAPDDLIAARGHWGQSLVVIPSMGVVAVRLANDREFSLDFSHYVELLVAAVKASEVATPLAPARPVSRPGRARKSSRGARR